MPAPPRQAEQLISDDALQVEQRQRLCTEESAARRRERLVRERVDRGTHRLLLEVEAEAVAQTEVDPVLRAVVEE